MSGTRLLRRERSPALGVGISYWVLLVADSGSVVSLQLLNLIGLCGISCRRILVIVRGKGLEGYGYGVVLVNPNSVELEGFPRVFPSLFFHFFD